MSVSVGSSKRDHEVEVDLAGQKVRIRREGTDGDLAEMIRRYQELDGTVDAFGLGGMTFTLKANGKSYYIREAKKVERAITETPIVDGSGLKDSLERVAVRRLAEETGVDLSTKKVLMTAAVDRFGMTEAFREAGSPVTYGDLMFGLDVPLPIRTDRAFSIVAAVLLPVMVQMPFKILYPIGSDQEKDPKPALARHYEEHDIIAGDYIYVRKYMPRDMSGKWVVTNTTTAEDVEDLRSRGVELLVTTTPRLEGRSFGTNLMEAAMVAVKDADAALTTEGYLAALGESGIESGMHWLQSGPGHARPAPDVRPDAAPSPA